MTSPPNSPRASQYRLFTGSVEGKAYWHWVALDPIKLALVSARIQQDSLDISEYGTIIRSGWGAHPPTLDEVLADKPDSE